MKKLIDDIVADSHLIGDFSQAEIKAAANAAPADSDNRVDCRKQELITIDDETAHDFDDAVGCRRLAGGGISLTVAIADVSAYVKAGSALDLAARARGNSVYLPDRVLPMLPVSLSNDTCSLKAGQDRLCVACEMEINDGTISRYRFFRGIMRSQHRLSYNESAAQMNGEGSSLTTLSLLAELTDNFRRQRLQRGGMILENPERYCVLDDNGQLNTGLRQRNIAHWAIEEAMIAANRCAADFLIRRDSPALFRVHPKPTAANVQKLQTVLSQLGVDFNDEPAAMDFSHALSVLEQRDEALAQALTPMVLGSLGRAEYKPTTKGHFGLSCSRYLHFTSPIRRYPDLLNHRALVAALANAAPALADEDLDAIGARCTETEVAADKMTWNCRRQLMCVPAKKYVGCVYSGYVSGMSDFGFFVTTPDLGIDGLVRYSSLPGYWAYDEKTRTLSGLNRTIHLGEVLDVRLQAVTPEKGRVDMTLVNVVQD